MVVCIAAGAALAGGRGGKPRDPAKLQAHALKQDAYHSKVEANEFDKMSGGAGEITACEIQKLLSKLDRGKPVEEDLVNLVIMRAAKYPEGTAVGHVDAGAKCDRAATLAALERVRKYRLHKPQIDELFTRCDTDCTGVLSPDQLRNALEIMEKEVFSKNDNRLAPIVGIETEHGAGTVKVDDKDVLTILHKVDENGDGLIDREEAVLALAAWREMATEKVNHCATCVLQ